MLPKVSVFLPTYQQVDLVGEAIDSVLLQDYPNLEIVVSDDGSTDGTPELLQAYARKHPGLFKVLLSDVNTGITANCNRTYAACTGEFTAYFSGDDVWLPEKLHKQVAWFAQHPGAVICYTNTENFDSASGKTLYLQHEPTRNPFRESGVEELFLSTVFFCGASVMARRSACPPEGYDTRLRYCSDWLFWVETARHGRIGYVEDVLTRYRLHPGNITKRVDVMLPDQRLAIDIVEDKYPDLALLANGLRSELLWRSGMEAFRAGHIDLAKDLLPQAFATGCIGDRHAPWGKRTTIYAALRCGCLGALHISRTWIRKMMGLPK